jgi:hypothetical protein
MGWRWQIPTLLDMQFHIIAIDCLGYGDTVSDFLEEV